MKNERNTQREHTYMHVRLYVSTCDYASYVDVRVRYTSSHERALNRARETFYASFNDDVNASHISFDDYEIINVIVC